MALLANNCGDKEIAPLLMLCRCLKRVADSEPEELLIKYEKKSQLHSQLFPILT